MMLKIDSDLSWTRVINFTTWNPEATVAIVVMHSQHMTMLCTLFLTQMCFLLPATILAAPISGLVSIHKDLVLLYSVMLLFSCGDGHLAWYLPEMVPRYFPDLICCHLYMLLVCWKSIACIEWNILLLECMSEIWEELLTILVHNRFCTLMCGKSLGWGYHAKGGELLTLLSLPSSEVPESTTITSGELWSWSSLAASHGRFCASVFSLCSLHHSQDLNW